MSADFSLSVVLPVHNAQFTVAEKIAALLDIVPELTRHFEILVIDDGSEDQTVEIAHEIALIYPQVSVVKHERRRGQAGIVQTALLRTVGEILLIQDEHAPIDASKFQRLWSLRGNEQLGRPVTRLDKRLRLSHRLAAWGIRLEEATTKGRSNGLQMLRRQDAREEKNTSRTSAPQRRSFTRVDDGANSVASRAAHDLVDLDVSWFEPSC